MQSGVADNDENNYDDGGDYYDDDDASDIEDDNLEINLKNPEVQYSTFVAMLKSLKTRFKVRILHFRFVLSGNNDPHHGHLCHCSQSNGDPFQTWPTSASWRGRSSTSRASGC